MTRKCCQLAVHAVLAQCCCHGLVLGVWFEESATSFPMLFQFVTLSRQSLAAFQCHAAIEFEFKQPEAVVHVAAVTFLPSLLMHPTVL